MAYYNADNVFPDMDNNKNSSSSSSSNNINNNNDKFRNLAGLFLYLKRTGQRNIARTHKVFKLGVVVLHVSLVLYLVGFLSPFWVVGARHEHKEGADVRVEDDDELLWSGDTVAAGGGSVVPLENQTHFGLWEECVVTEGRTTCTLFTEDIDSLILMFATVGLFVLVSLCGWTLLASVRKQRKRRYVLTVVGAIVGGAFGFVTIFIFIAVQGQKPYSWALVVYFIACFLESSSGAAFMCGIVKASAEAGAFDDSSEEAEGDAKTQAEVQNATAVEVEAEAEAQATRSLPFIVITGTTPQGKKKTNRRVQIILRGNSPTVVSNNQHSRCQETAVSLDMVSPLPDQPRTNTNGRRRLKKGLKGKQAPPSSFDRLHIGDNSAERHEEKTAVATAATAAGTQMALLSRDDERDRRREPAHCATSTPPRCLPKKADVEYIEMGLLNEHGEHGHRQRKLAQHRTSASSHVDSSPPEIRAAEDIKLSLLNKHDKRENRSKQALCLAWTANGCIPLPTESPDPDTQMTECRSISLHRLQRMTSRPSTLSANRVIVDVLHKPVSLGAHVVSVSENQEEEQQPQSYYCDMGTPLQSAENVATPPHSPHPFPPHHKRLRGTESREEVVASPAVMDVKTGSDFTLSAAPRADRERRARGNATPAAKMSSGCARNAGEEKRENAKEEAADYIRYSPDTNLQTRGNCYIFNFDDVAKSGD